MSDEDMSYINPEDGPTKLFGIQGLYQKLKTEQRHNYEVATRKPKKP